MRLRSWYVPSEGGCSTFNGLSDGVCVCIGKLGNEQRAVVAAADGCAESLAGADQHPVESQAVSGIWAGRGWFGGARCADSWGG